MCLNTQEPHHIGALILETANRSGELLSLISHDKWISSLPMFHCTTQEDVNKLLNGNGRRKGVIIKEDKDNNWMIINLSYYNKIITLLHAKYSI